MLAVLTSGGLLASWYFSLALYEGEDGGEASERKRASKKYQCLVKIKAHFSLFTTIAGVYCPKSDSSRLQGKATESKAFLTNEIILYIFSLYV